MVYGFVKQSGGYLKIDTAVGVGTTVHIYLPRVEGDPVQVDVVQPTVEVPRGAGETVLVVEDDEFVERVAVRQLERLGYVPLRAVHAKAALEILRSSEAVDLLFTDIVLPGGMNGNQLAHQALAVRPDLKVLFASGYSEEAEWRDGTFGIDAELLRKPYTGEQLAIAIHRSLGDA